MKGECPTCHQDIDEDFVKEKIEYHTVREAHYKKFADTKTQEKEEAEKVNRIRTVAKRKIEEWEDIFRDIDRTLPKTVLDAFELEEKIESLKNKIREDRNKLQEVVQENERIERHNTRISIIEEQQTEFENQLSELVEEITEI